MPRQVFRELGANKSGSLRRNRVSDPARTHTKEDISPTARTAGTGYQPDYASNHQLDLEDLKLTGRLIYYVLRPIFGKHRNNYTWNMRVGKERIPTLILMVLSQNHPVEFP
ncbi:hypothetical protein RRG08_003932 [Elysia crispata]|uniref:Uncharacterized protein n=1 Tax=Elysia crispata TaxID=231223 RepID=A0AAE0YBC4_9GAST|nr:hypothetical protein RRG08_003932 [Elysia crispata]